MTIVLGLAAAVVYGAADFLGGLATKRSGAYCVVVWSQFAGLVVLALAAVVLGDPFPGMRDIGWGALGGVGGGAGVVLLYRGLSIGRMAVVAPTAAVFAAAVPVAMGIVLGERPHVAALAGVAVALLAIVLVSSGPGEPHATAPAAAAGWRKPGLLEALGAGLGFALFFVCLDNTAPDAGLWPLLAARVSIAVAAVAALATRTSMRPAPGTLGRIAIVGVLDMVANLLYLLASRRGLLSIVAVLVSLYPASTVVLARFVLNERLSARQLGGLLAAGAGVALIAAV